MLLYDVCMIMFVIGGLWWVGMCWGVGLLGCGGVYCGVQCVGECDGVVFGLEVYVEQVWLFVEFVVVYGDDVDFVVVQCLDDVLDFGGGYDEIVVDCCVVVVGGLEVEGGSQIYGWGDEYVGYGDWIVVGDEEFVYFVCDGVGVVQCFIDGCGVQV